MHLSCRPESRPGSIASLKQEGAVQLALSLPADFTIKIAYHWSSRFFRITAIRSVS